MVCRLCVLRRGRGRLRYEWRRRWAVVRRSVWKCRIGGRRQRRRQGFRLVVRQQRLARAMVVVRGGCRDWQRRLDRRGHAIVGVDLLLQLIRNVRRSEEHTSELQSLMRISYAVFCLNKKINKTHQTRNI